MVCELSVLLEVVNILRQFSGAKSGKEKELAAKLKLFEGRCSPYNFLKAYENRTEYNRLLHVNSSFSIQKIRKIWNASVFPHVLPPTFSTSPRLTLANTRKRSSKSEPITTRPRSIRPKFTLLFSPTSRKTPKIIPTQKFKVGEFLYKFDRVLVKFSKWLCNRPFAFVMFHGIFFVSSCSDTNIDG